MRRFSFAVLGLAALGSSFLISGASAMPVAPLAATPSANVENVRWVCGPYRCFWQPNYYGYGYGRPAFYGYGPRYYGGGGYRRWHRW